MLSLSYLHFFFSIYFSCSEKNKIEPAGDAFGGEGGRGVMGAPGESLDPPNFLYILSLSNPC